MSAGGSWKVAYADFVTAMMAFFLLMWILNMVPKDKLVIIEGYFKAPGGYGTSNLKDVSAPPAAPIAPPSVETYTPTEAGQTNVEIGQKLSELLEQDQGMPSDAGSVTVNEAGVLMRVTGNVMFDANGFELSGQGKTILDKVIAVMNSYRVYLMVRGHTSASETGEPNFPSKWELSAARASSAVRYIIEKGKLDPYMVTAVSYADTRPLYPGDAPQNRRVEFYFYRPEAKSGIMGF